MIIVKKIYILSRRKFFMPVNMIGWSADRMIDILLTLCKNTNYEKKFITTLFFYWIFLHYEWYKTR